ncbi:serine/threonine protein kinase [Tolypothrix sp. NIES-4075]|uniref:protein kinase domain-containing protein n=1 Tax=Tolypothrix sp. NIES-4075 TaxID=2005459 RepID=UPI000B702D27|nr:IMS domain-containing protein [Tolypothrix sp. NIES-4075]GAX42595.1 serine/threonine protein kinase [Tolypothrix sp. NIES-4075]
MTPMLLKNRYQVIRVLGSGGFGETFLAEDTQMPSGCRCVIKQLKPVVDNPQVYQLVQERFQREAAILEELGGNNQIPRLNAYFVEDGQFYLVQEYIEGQTLTQKLQQGTLSESSVKEILINILPVLEYVHSKRIVHRDIKPDNILIRYADGKPILIDFGAVKETMGTVVTASGNSSRSIVIGTPGFMPSEQTAGRPVFSSDLYSLGLTAIYLLTGKIPQELPTDPATGEIVWRHYALSVSTSFAAVLDKAIASHARDRFSSAREMLQALQTGATFIAPNPTIVSAPPPGGYVQQTVVSAAPAGVPYQQQPIYSQPVNQVSKGMGDWQKAVIMGGVIGACVVGGLWITRGQQSPQIESKPTQVEAKPAPTQQSVSLTPSSSTPQTPTSINSSSTPSSVETSTQTHFSPSTSSSIAKQEAVALINRWQEAKKALFAPPFNRQLGAELTTGEAYRKNIGSGSSLEWLQDNNAYYRYGVQRLDSLENFVASGDQATIEVVLTEERTLYKSDGNIDRDNTALDTRLIRYSLQRENGQLKISDYSTVRVISSR